MKNILLVSNLIKDPKQKLTEEIRAYIESKGASCKVVIKDPEAKDIAYVTAGDKVDCIIVLGGDGTILHAARDTAGVNVPILGINLGTLGFLAEVDPAHAHEAIDRVLSGDYETQDRMMLQARVLSNGKETKLSPALNDVNIIRCGSLQIVRFGIYVNGEFLCNMGADGIIVATPTGSTAYNMSAGGPIVKPEADIIVLTPICAHTLNARSIVLSADDVIEISIDKANDGGTISLEVNSDGNDRLGVSTGDRIVIARSEYRSRMVRLSKVSFLQTLQKKMSE